VHLSGGSSSSLTCRHWPNEREFERMDSQQK
jgi:hypothetical protein